MSIDYLYLDLDKLLPATTPVIIDVAVIVRILWVQHKGGSTSFFANRIGPLAALFDEQMEIYLSRFLGNRKRVYVFEGNSPEKTKIRTRLECKSRSKLLSKSIKLLKLGPEYLKGAGESILNQVVQPSAQFWDALLYRLARKGETVYKAVGEADFCISHLLNTDFATAAVVSSDADFLLFSKCEYLITPQYRYNALIIIYIYKIMFNLFFTVAVA